MNPDGLSEVRFPQVITVSSSVGIIITSVRLENDSERWKNVFSRSCLNHVMI